MLTATLTYNRTSKSYDVNLEHVEELCFGPANVYYFDNAHQALGILLCAPQHPLRRCKATARVAYPHSLPRGSSKFAFHHPTLHKLGCKLGHLPLGSVIMGNMSYCRFQDTSTDLVDCLDELEAQVSGDDGEGEPPEPLSEHELYAAERLVQTCAVVCAIFLERGADMPVDRKWVIEEFLNKLRDEHSVADATAEGAES